MWTAPCHTTWHAGRLGRFERFNVFPQERARRALHKKNPLAGGLPAGFAPSPTSGAG